MYSVYIMECEDGLLYVGSTRLNPAKRLLQHAVGELSRWAHAHRPIRIIYVERFRSARQAARREKQLKGWSRAKKLALASGDIEALRRLSKPTKASP
jgi:putative endonuclease